MATHRYRQDRHRSNARGLDECSTCGALPDKPCTSAGGNVSKPHAGRMRRVQHVKILAELEWERRARRLSEEPLR